MTKRVERPKTAPNACLPKSELYSATLLPDGDLLVLVRHVFLNVCGDNEDLPDDASRQVKHLAGKLLSVYQENEDKYLKRCEQNFKNRTGEDTDGYSKEMEQPTNDRRTSDERPRNKNKSNQDKSNQEKENNESPQSIHLSPEGYPLDVEGVKEIAHKINLEAFCDDGFAIDFLNQNRPYGWKDQTGKPIKHISSWLKKKLLDKMNLDYVNLVEQYKSFIVANPKETNLAKASDYAKKLIPLTEALLAYGQVIEEDRRRMEGNLVIWKKKLKESQEDEDEPHF